MSLNFWQKLPKPIMVLAPMADVTDSAFRRVIAKYGKPDVMWTEFVSADGLCHPKGREKLLVDLSYTDAERPIVAQLFSGKPEKMYEASKLVRELGFDGIDINMGCPDRAIEKSGAGANLIKDSERARAIIRAAKEGAGGERGIPVSVKTRIGYNKNEIETWIPELLAEKPAVITVHARTRKEMSDVPARWEHVKEAVALRDRFSPETLIFGNGDVIDIADARQKAMQTGCNGVMLGRAIFGNPWLFNNNPPSISVAQRLEVMLEHTKLFDELFHGVKNFAIMKKHYKAYVNGFDGSKELRIKLMETDNFSQVEKIILDYLEILKNSK